MQPVSIIFHICRTLGPARTCSDRISPVRFALSPAWCSSSSGSGSVSSGFTSVLEPGTVKGCKRDVCVCCSFFCLTCLCYILFCISDSIYPSLLQSMFLTFCPLVRKGVHHLCTVSVRMPLCLCIRTPIYQHIYRLPPCPFIRSLDH